MTIRRLARDVLVYGSGEAVLRATAFITLPIYSRLFDPEEFGIWSFLVTLTFLLNVMLMFGTDAAYGRFFFATRDAGERQILTSTLFAYVAVASTVVGVALLPLSPLASEWAFGDSERATLFALVFLTGPVLVVNAFLGQALRNEFRAAMFGVLNVATAICSVALSLYLIVVHDWGVKGALAGALGGALVVLPVRVWTVRALLRPAFSRAVLRRALVFGLPLVPAAVTGWIIAMSDRVILGKLSSFEEVGLYAVAASVTSVITFLLTPLGQAWSPHAVEAYERAPEEARAFYGRVLTYILVGFGLLAVAVTAFADELLALLTTPEFHDAESAIAPLALSAVAFATVQVTAGPIAATGKTFYVPLVSASGALLNVVLNLVFVPRYGMEASAWATAVTAVVLTSTYAAVSRRLWPISYERRRLVAIAAAVLVFTLAAQLLPDVALAAAIPLKIAYCAAFVGVLFTLRGLDTRELRAARQLFRGVAPS